jgi:hypothetical protein
VLGSEHEPRGLESLPRRGKLSAHVVVDGFFHADNVEAREFYNFVLGAIQTDSLIQLALDRNRLQLNRILDRMVYSTKQHFRVLGSHKVGRTNTKTFMDRWRFRDLIVTHAYKKNHRSTASRAREQLYSSLVTVTPDSDCVYFHPDSFTRLQSFSTSSDEDESDPF